MTETKSKPKRRLSDVPKPVAKRYWRRRTGPAAKAIARRLMRLRLPKMERARVKALEAAFETTKHYAIKNEHGSFPAVKLFMNIGLYLLIAARDIQALKIDALTHPDEWTRKLNARIILLTIYEWDADKVTGRQLREAFDIVQAPESLRTRTVEVLRDLRLVQRKVAKEFLFVRNAAIAHRDPDALVQYRAIQDLSVEKVFVAAGDFFAAVDSFMPVLTNLMQISSSFPILLREWKEKP